MKKLWKWLVGILALGVAMVILFFAMEEQEKKARSEVERDLPRDIGIATEAYNKLLDKKLQELNKAKAEEIVARFKKSFGGA